MASVAMTGARRLLSNDPQLSVSVVTYNNAHCLPVFLDSLRQQTGMRSEVFFFDNASRDKTPALIQKAALGELFISDSNIGYSRAHNHNAARCHGKHLLLLNPDLEFGPDLFGALLRNFEEHPEYSIAGPRIVEGLAKRPFPPRYFYPGEGMVALEPGLRRREIAWLNGCCLIVRREVFEGLGGFDPDFFLYQGETDFCLRARRAGYKIGYAGSTSVYHLHRQSQRGLSEYEFARRIFQGSAVFWEKHYAPSDMLRMVRFQYWISRLILVLGPVQRWLPELPAVLSQARLRARSDICREWLEKNGYRRGGPAGVLGKIALRQCRLAVKFILQRRFPLDDY
jgi:GT2 family glycosyltransferase